MLIKQKKYVCTCQIRKFIISRKDVNNICVVVSPIIKFTIDIITDCIAVKKIDLTRSRKENPKYL